MEINQLYKKYDLINRINNFYINFIQEKLTKLLITILKIKKNYKNIWSKYYFRRQRLYFGLIIIKILFVDKKKFLKDLCLICSIQNC